MGTLKDRLIYALGGYTEYERLRTEAFNEKLCGKIEELRKNLAEAQSALDAVNQKLLDRRDQGFSRNCPRIRIDNAQFTEIKLEAHLPDVRDWKTEDYTEKNLSDSILKETRKYVQISQRQDQHGTHMRARLWVGVPIVEDKGDINGEI